MGTLIRLFRRSLKRQHVIVHDDDILILGKQTDYRAIEGGEGATPVILTG